MDSPNEEAPGQTDTGAASKTSEPDVGANESPPPYTGPERRAQGYLTAEGVESPEPQEPTRPSDFPA